MAQNKSITLATKDALTGAQNGQLTLEPLKARNGIFEYSGADGAGTEDIFSWVSPSRITASVRQGTPANFIAKVPRVKRRSTIKMAFAIDAQGEAGPIVDYITMDIVLSSPVEATEEQIRSVLSAAETAVFNTSVSPLRDIVVHGREPY